MNKISVLPLTVVVTLSSLIGCAAPAPTATPTTTQIAAPTPTKAPTATPTKRPLTKVPMAHSRPSPAKLPVLVADAKGWFQEEGIDPDWTMTGSGAKAVAAIIGGSAPIGLAVAADTIAAVAQGQPIQAIAVEALGHSIDLSIRNDVAKQKGVTAKSSFEEKVKALRGLKIGASSPGSGSDYTIRFALAKFGLDPERDVEIVYSGSTTAALVAMKTGAIDAMSAAPDQWAIATVEGFGMQLVAFSGGEVPEASDNYYDVAFAHRQTIQSDPDLLVGFIKGLWRGLRLIRSNPTEARELGYRYFPEMDRKAYDITMEALHKSYPDSPVLTEKAFESTKSFQAATTGQPPAAITFADYANTALVEAAKKQLGF